MASAFEGVRVLDLSTRVSGAWAARLFGDFGAEVIRVDTEQEGSLQSEPPFVNDISLLSSYVNWNKSPADGTQLQVLLEQADVVVTTAPADRLPEISETCIHLSITPHGLTGPWADFAGNDLTHCARSGWCAINRYADEEPLQLPPHQPSLLAGVAGFIGAAAALTRGAPERVDVSELEATALTCMPWAIMGIFIGGDRLAYGPNRKRVRGNAGPLWRASDGLINYGYGDWQQWQNALHFLGQHELAEDPNYISQWGRHQQDPVPVRDGLSKASATRGKWELFHGLADYRCISGVVQTAKDLSECEQLIARDFLVETEVDGIPLRTTGPIAKLSATPWRLGKSAPLDDTQKVNRFASEGRLPNARDSQALPLHGTRVLCFTQAWAGTFATEILALLGADVVQIETVKRPDVWRGAGAPIPTAVRDEAIEQSQLNTNGMYNSVNLNKRAITLDVTHPRGKAMFWDMIEKFDVLVDNFSPHVMTDWGVTLETLHERRPDMIFASVSGYGRQGPLAEYPANGATTEPMAGFASVHGYDGDEAMNTGGLIPDPISGYYLAASILAAIHHRARTGEGQRIDAAMIEAVSVQLGPALLDYAANGHIQVPIGNKHPRIAPHGVFACADGRWLAVAAETDGEFADLCTHIEQPGLAADTRFATNASRKANEPALNEILSEWFSDKDAGVETRALLDRQIHAAECADFLPIYRDSNPQFEHRGFLLPVTHPETGTHLLATMPWVMSNTAPSEVRHSPRFGEHSQEVFAQELGMTEQDYAELVALNITGTERVGT
jgi:crotonobetainyl-CoA:carnitine CoA-transferase CaiB-like acyl-CoA transferase